MFLDVLLNVPEFTKFRARPGVFEACRCIDRVREKPYKNFKKIYSVKPYSLLSAKATVLSMPEQSLFSTTLSGLLTKVCAHSKF